VSLSLQNNSKVLKNSIVKSDIFVKLSRSFCSLFTSDKVSGFFVEAINSSYDEHKEIFLKFWMT
jgi:hypothetical protein